MQPKLQRVAVSIEPSRITQHIKNVQLYPVHVSLKHRSTHERSHHIPGHSTRLVSTGAKYGPVANFLSTPPFWAV